MQLARAILSAKSFKILLTVSILDISETSKDQVSSALKLIAILCMKLTEVGDIFIDIEALRWLFNMTYMLKSLKYIL